MKKVFTDQKQVIAVYANDGKFKQYLKKSEVRFLLDIMKDTGGPIKTELVKISIARYESEFGVC